MTASRTTDAYLDCALVENAVVLSEGPLLIVYSLSVCLQVLDAINRQFGDHLHALGELQNELAAVLNT